MLNRYSVWTALGPVSWVAWGMLAVFIASLLRGERARRFARRTLWLTMAWAFIICAGPMGYYLMDALETRFPRPSATAVASARDILVLAGGEHLSASARNGRPEFSEHGDRVIAGAMLAHQLPAARLWTVGGNRASPDTPRDVDWTKLAWVQLGVDPRRIMIVGGTADTCGNALGVATQLGRGARPLLVTSAFHMPRAMACFRAAGIEPIAYPVDYLNGTVPNPIESVGFDFADNATHSDLALHEYVGLAWYRLTGRTRELWPDPTQRTTAAIQ